MTETTKNWNPLFAWAKSLPLAIGIPAILWLVFMIFGTLFFGRGAEGVSGSLGIAVIIILYSSTVHFGAYLIFGIPMFYLLKREKFAFFWQMPYGWLLGILTGIIPPLVVAGIMWGVETQANELLFATVLLGTYGFITAFAAWRQRPV